MKNKPPYAIDSVDHALHLAQLLQQEGPLRVTDAAERLGVSPSTAHRLLAMLVYRGFAEQGPDRRYRAGDLLRPAPASEAPVTLLRQVALPHLHALVERCGSRRTSSSWPAPKCASSPPPKCDQILRVGDRVGTVLPAHLASGGKALLAALPANDLTARYDGSDDVDLRRLRRELNLVRKRGSPSTTS